MDRLRILIVEDDTIIGMGLQDYLTRMGHEVVGDADDMVGGLRLFLEKQPDAMIVDIRLKDGGDGIELARECFKTRAVPVIVISAFSDAELVARAAAAG